MINGLWRGGRTSWRWWAICVAAWCGVAMGAWGEVRVSPLWSDGGVVQSGEPVAVFGSGEPGDRVTVAFAGHRGEGVVDARGGWRVELPALEPSGEPRQMTVTGPTDSRVVGDLLVGEVWVCSGQSNMWWPVSRSDDAAAAIAASGDEQLRLFTVKQGTSARPRVTVEGSWAAAGPETTGEFSATAYYFGRALRRELGVPVGLVHASYSGSPIESWVRPKSMRESGAFDNVLAAWDEALIHWDETIARTYHTRRLADHQRAEAEGTLEPVNGRTPRTPAYRDVPNLIHRPGNLYHAMIAPLTRLPVRGVVWYQGEANARSAAAYRTQLMTLIDDWRSAWSDPELAFLGVQIPNFAPVQERPIESWWAELRESQAKGLADADAGVVVTIDLGEADDIHPSNKKDVGERLALKALDDVYERVVVSSGPVFAEMRPAGREAVVTFAEAAGLTTTDGEAVRGFAVAGADRRWRWADGVIEGQTVRVSSDEVDRPVAVRYAWASNPVANLTNAAGLPAAPFRTDDWPMVTDGVTWLPWLDEAMAWQRGLRVPALFADHMVLQRDVAVPVWGWDAPGRRVTVRAAGQSHEAEAGEDGAWRVELSPMPAGGPIELSIVSDGGESVTVRDALVGDVWLCSGQSNMQWPVSRSNDPQRVAAGADHPRLRLMTVREVSDGRSPRDVTGRWEPCTPESVRDFSAVGYHFGSGLLDRLDVPIGLIDNALGGTRAEAWTSMSALRAEPELAPLLTKWEAYNQAWDNDSEHALYERRRATWLPIYREMRAAGQRPPRGPRLDSRRPDSRDHPANLYRGVVAPLTDFPIRGVIWYQGESNANRAVQYRTLFPAMIRDWRQRWDDPDLPFVFVQIAGWGPFVEEPEDHERAELRDAQTAALNLPNTAMVTAVDVGEVDIHPKDKQTVGERLTLAVRRLVYGDDVVANGPSFAGMRIESDAVRLTFDHVGGGLVVKEGEPLVGFAVAEADGNFVWADARIEGDTVVVRSESVPEPAAVRYGWAGHPHMSLYNREGWPALPFRTDNRPLLTRNVHGPWD